MAILAILAIMAMMAILAIIFRNVGANKLLKVTQSNPSAFNTIKVKGTVKTKRDPLRLVQDVAHILAKKCSRPRGKISEIESIDHEQH